MTTKTTKTTGFYGTDDEVYYVTPLGRAFIVASCDDIGPGPREIDPADIPAEAVEVDDLLTPAESLDHCRRVEEASGEKLIDES